MGVVDFVIGNWAVFLLPAALIIARLVYAAVPKAITKRAPALPGYGWKVVYSDNASARSRRDPDIVYGKILKDALHSLQGKPDFIYSNGVDFMPVELKSGRIGADPRPREGDLMQLAVYFFLIEAEYETRPKTGRLIYSDAMFAVKNTRQIRDAVLDIVDEMEEMTASPEAPDEAEPEFNKCRRCPCRGTVCETEKDI